MTSEMKTSFYPVPTSTSSNQDPTTPPAALTIVLSVACGAVATCILVTIILLLLRHRSYKQAFRQGSRPTGSAAAVTTGDGGDKAHPPFLGLGETRADSSDGSTLALNTQDAVVAYLPILHSSSSRTRAREPGHVLSLTYPKRAHLGLSRSAMSLPSHIV
ncbi:hypothetical protein F5888DRAFT_1735122 [Russula emetica]|nr:hypothetical protein F5888DRAFT_1735122 [Russula emetica]